jgi:hypothetical protein
MKKSHYMLWTMTLLFAFVIVHISAIFYIANKTESEVNAAHALRSTETNIPFENLNHVASSQPLAIN